jgi:hypothetical protein
MPAPLILTPMTTTPPPITDIVIRTRTIRTFAIVFIPSPDHAALGAAPRITGYSDSEDTARRRGRRHGHSVYPVVNGRVTVASRRLTVDEALAGVAR